jgi:hypothetical protein
VALSDDGRRILAALESRQQAWLGRCLRGLSRAELERLARSLGALAERVDSATGRERADDGAGTGRSGHRPATGGRRRLVAA